MNDTAEAMKCEHGLHEEACERCSTALYDDAERTKSGPQGSKRCVEFKCHTPDDCAIAGYCIPSMDDEPIDQIVYPGTSGIAPGLSKVVG